MTVAILGVGVMGETLLSGLIRGGRPVDELLVGEKRAERAAQLTEKYGVRVVSNVEAVAQADTVALVVKPQDMAEVLEEISSSLTPGTLLVSLAAGITTEFIESRVPDGIAVVRVMPNTPALVDEGMAAISPGTHCDDDHLAVAESLLRTTGRVVRVPEKQQDAVTAISGSGPAYLFFVVEAMIEAGVHLGLPRSTATELVVQTVVGSAKLLRETGEHPTVLREQVTSPGGTTAAAIRELESHRVRAAFMTAMEAARNRSRELAGESQGGRVGGGDLVRGGLGHRDVRSDFPISSGAEGLGHGRRGAGRRQAGHSVDAQKPRNLGNSPRPRPRTPPTDSARQQGVVGGGDVPAAVRAAGDDAGRHRLVPAGQRPGRAVERVQRDRQHDAVGDLLGPDQLHPVDAAGVDRGEDPVRGRRRSRCCRRCARRGW